MAEHRYQPIFKAKSNKILQQDRPERREQGDQMKESLQVLVLKTNQEAVLQVQVKVELQRRKASF